MRYVIVKQINKFIYINVIWKIWSGIFDIFFLLEIPSLQIFQIT